MGIVLGSKRVIFRRGTPALYRPQVFPSYNLPIPWQVLTFGEFAMQTNEMFTLVNIEHKLVEPIRVAIFLSAENKSIADLNLGK